MQVYKSYSLVASILCALTIGLTVTGILTVLIIVILYYTKNMFHIPDWRKSQSFSAEDSADLELFTSKQEPVPDSLELVLLSEATFYCIANIILLGKWVGLTNLGADFCCLFLKFERDQNQVTILHIG